MAGHALLQPIGALSGPGAQHAPLLFGLDRVQLGDQPTSFGIVQQTLRPQVQFIVAVAPLIAATGAHASRAHAVLGQLDIMPGQLAADIADKNEKHQITKVIVVLKGVARLTCSMI